MRWVISVASSVGCCWKDVLGVGTIGLNIVLLLDGVLFSVTSLFENKSTEPQQATLATWLPLPIARGSHLSCLKLQC